MPSFKAWDKTQPRIDPWSLAPEFDTLQTGAGNLFTEDMTDVKFPCRLHNKYEQKTGLLMASIVKLSPQKGHFLTETVLLQADTKLQTMFVKWWLIHVTDFYSWLNKNNKQVARWTEKQFKKTFPL